jgi:anion-transporting  ArsA/GET3 family ATPase
MAAMKELYFEFYDLIENRDFKKLPGSDQAFNEWVEKWADEISGTGSDVRDLFEDIHQQLNLMYQAEIPVTNTLKQLVAVIPQITPEALQAVVNHSVARMPAHIEITGWDKITI